MEFDDVGAALAERLRRRFQVKQSIVITSLSSLIVAIAGCSSNGNSSQSVAAGPNDYDDVAQAVGSVVATTGGGGEVGSLADSVDLAVGVVPLGIAVDASGEFAGSRLGLDYDYQLSCKDAAGAALSACGLTTNTANVKVDWSGDLGLPNFSAAVTRQGDWSLSGVQTDTVQFAGDGTFSFDAKFTSIFRPASVEYRLDYAATYDGVTMQRSLHRVVGGAIHYSITAERMAASDQKTAEATFDMAADLSFSSAGTATLVLDGSHRYTLDTGSGAVARVGAE
jgi:hypothetical protein